MTYKTYCALSASILVAVITGCKSELKPPPQAAVAHEHFQDVSLSIDGRTTDGQPLTVAAGETASIAGEFRVVDGELSTLKLLLLAESEGKEATMQQAFVDFKVSEDRVTFEAPFRMTPKPGEFELRIEGVLGRNAQEMDKNVVASTIVRVVEAE